MDQKPVHYAIELVGISKKFKRRTLTRNNYSTLKSSLINLFRKKEEKKEHITHAIKDLTLRIPQGSSVGIIGENGSGKSTLLKLISGIYRPDTGSVSINGRIAALIELGAGFHPDFSGRENLFLGGTLHGLTRAEVAARFNKIVDFAQLQDVIDDPVRTYSSGMFMRLGFSLAIHTDPDVLIIDEVLAVGDAAFVNKCKEKIAGLRKTGKTLLLVTHDLSAVERWCDEAIWLQDGVAYDRGNPRRVIDNYLSLVGMDEEKALLAKSEQQKQDNSQAAQADASTQDKQESDTGRWGSREIEITAVRVVDENNQPKRVFSPEDSIAIKIDWQKKDPQLVDNLVFGIGINRSDGLVVHGSNTDIEDVALPQLTRQGTVTYKIERLGVLDGIYSVDAAVHRSDGYPFDYHKNALSFAVRSNTQKIGLLAPKNSWFFGPQDSRLKS